MEDVEVAVIVTPPFSHCFEKVEGPRWRVPYAQV